MNRTRKDNSITENLLPPKTAEQKAPSRRSLMKGTVFGSLLQLPDGVESSNADAKLISLCEQFRWLERINREFWYHDDPEFWATIYDRQEVLVSKISALSPRSVADFQAIARALTGWVDGTPTDEIDDLCGADAELIGLLLRGLIEARVN